MVPSVVTVQPTARRCATVVSASMAMPVIRAGRSTGAVIGRGSGGVPAYVTPSVDGAAAVLDEQLGDTVRGVRRQLRIDAALEAVTGIGVHAELAGAADDGAGNPMRSLKNTRVVDSVTRVVQPPITPPSATPVGIGDDGEARIKRDFALVEQLQRFAGARMAHDQRSGKRAGVERMQRLPELEHHVIGDVHQRDRPHPGQLDQRRGDRAAAVARRAGRSR